MELFTRFKKDYFNYLASVILPALISGISIPVFKRTLGPEGYGQFALWFNAILIMTSVLSGWIMQSVIRFFPACNNKQDFTRNSLGLSVKTQAIFALPIALIVWFISKDLLLVILCTCALFSISIQFTILPIIQSSFLSKKVIFSELIRILIYVGGGILFLLFTKIYFLYGLLIAVIASYLSSFSYLYMIRKREFKNKMDQSAIETNNTRQLIKQFYHYGVPLSIWFVFSNLLTYVDKLFAFHLFGANYQGNYQAIFDLINKSLTLLILPVVTALFPLLTAAYESGDKKGIRNFLKKILLYELLGFFAVSVGYWIFGARLVFLVLKTPDTYTYKWVGYIIICATFILQFAVIAQKKYELTLRTQFLLSAIIIAFLAQILFYFLFRNSSNQFIAPFGFLIASFIYLFLILLSELRKFLNFEKINSILKIDLKTRP